MQKSEAIIFLSLVMVIFLILAFVFHLLLCRLSDLRTLKLGRLTLLTWICGLVAFNAFVGIFLTMNPIRGLKNNLLAIEGFTLFSIPLVLGLILVLVVLFLSIKMWLRGSKSVTNFLLPLLMLFFLIVDGLYLVIRNGLPEDWLWLRLLLVIYPALAIYFSWQFLVFLVSSIVYGQKTKEEKCSVLVVLGAGLIDGHIVGPLLAGRIKTAVTSATDDSIFIMSGGKGEDEQVSEASAMKKYAVEKLDIAADRILVEEQSRNTLENLKFSSQMLKKPFIFFSSDFHIFRAALFAASLDLDAQGSKGSKTTIYYRTVFFIREFVAVLNSQRKKHIAIVVGMVTFIIFLTIIALLLQKIVE